MSDKTIGLYEKFKVERTDGSSVEGAKHAGCEYFTFSTSRTIPSRFRRWRLTPTTQEKAGYALLAADLRAKVTLRSGAAPATPSLLDQPTPTAYRGHKNQALPDEWIYTESRCPSEWAERDGIEQEPLYLSGAAPATDEPTPLTERERTDVMRAHDRARTLLGAYDGADPEVKPTLDQVFVAIDDLARAAGSSSPSGASGTEEGTR